MRLLLNLLDHFVLRLGFILAERRQSSALVGDALLEEINERWGVR